MRLSLSLGILVAFVGCAVSIHAQTSNMTDEQQAWFYCLVSTKWCLATSTDKQTREEKVVAMVAGNKPLNIRGRVSRLTLQIGCANGKPVTMIHTARGLEDSELLLRYRLDPSGKMGDLHARNASAGHFFEFQAGAFLKDLANATKASFEVALPSEKERNVIEFNVEGTDGMLKRLQCFS